MTLPKVSEELCESIRTQFTQNPQFYINRILNKLSERNKELGEAILSNARDIALEIRAVTGCDDELYNKIFTNIAWQGLAVCNVIEQQMIIDELV